MPVTIDVSANDAHPTGDTLTIVEFTDGAHGTVTLVGDQLVYTPEPGFVGHDVFTYTVEDSSGDRTRAAVSVHVVNGQPTAVDDTVTTGVGTPISIDVLANDIDPNGDMLTVLSVSQLVGGTASINADGTVTFTPDEDRREPATFTYTISDGNGGMSSASVTVNFVENFASPTGEKTINPQGFPELEWRIVWINSDNGSANTVRVIDPIPVGTTFIPGSLTCDAMGNSAVTRCDYDSAANQVIVDGVIGPDLGAASEAAAVNEVVITFRISVPLDFFGTVENQAQVYWDSDGDGMVDDDLVALAGQMPALSDDPVTPEPNDPTVGTFAPGACLFQVRPTEIESDDDSDTSIEATGDLVEDGFEGTEVRQASPSPLTLTTPTAGQAIAGSSVAVAAVQGPSVGPTVSESITSTVANNNTQTVPDIIEADGVKTEVLPAFENHTVVTDAGLLVTLPDGGLEVEDTLEVRTVSEAELPLPLPGVGATGYYQLTLSGGRTQLDQALTLRLPYSDIDQNTQVDGTSLSETALTLWRYAPERGTWEHVPEAMVIPETDVVVASTDQIGLLGVFRATDGRLATLGSADDDVVALGTAFNAVGDLDDNEGWATIGEARRAPHVMAWDTTAWADGQYDLRVVCALDSTQLSAFETAPVTQTTGNGGSSNCFIATAAYGSPFQPQVRALRQFRDVYLTTHRPGRWLVDQYYRLSPPLADMIRERDGLRAAVRVALTPLVWTIKFTQTALGWAVLTGLLLAVGGALGMGFGYWRRQR